MSKMLQLDKSYDLYLSHSWSNNNHGICGHTYEILDYFLFLRHHFKVGILFCDDDINLEVLLKAANDKYDLTTEEINAIKVHARFEDKPLLVKGNNILLVDGGISMLKSVTLLFNKIMMFACGDKTIKDNTKDNIFILQDNRVYDKVKTNGIHYIKKINFNKYKQTVKQNNSIMLYGTKNCRLIKNDTLETLLARYKEPFIVLKNKETEENSTKTRVKYLQLPVEGLFNLFGTYVYTPVPRHFDCSPRFIAECKFYDKNVIYHDIDYLDEDTGLYWRKFDIENNFQSLFLTEDDEIINIIKGII